MCPSGVEFGAMATAGVLEGRHDRCLRFKRGAETRTPSGWCLPRGSPSWPLILLKFVAAGFLPTWSVDRMGLNTSSFQMRYDKFATAWNRDERRRHFDRVDNADRHGETGVRRTKHRGRSVARASDA